MGDALKNAVFANGCFWCTEAVFRRLRGVHAVVPGYTGGTTQNPTYASVSEGDTGHAEAIKITYDPTLVSYSDLLTVFFGTHDPTTLNRQGNDVGTQYRSAIFFATDDEERAARAYIEELTAAHAYPDPIVTEVAPLGVFYEAEAYHHRYYEENQNAPYCMLVITPKLEKFEKRFAALLAH